MIAINRETIIEIIKKSDVCLYEKSDNDRLIEEIKALSFIEVCEDCVSREDAMSMIVCYGNEIKAEVMDDIKASMIKLPPVTPTQKWIPVSGWLPRQGVEVLCQCQANIYEVLKLTADGWYHDDNHCYMLGFVTAWQPLPKPYEEKRGNENADTI